MINEMLKQLSKDALYMTRHLSVDDLRKVLESALPVEQEWLRRTEERTKMLEGMEERITDLEQTAVDKDGEIIGSDPKDLKPTPRHTEEQLDAIIQKVKESDKPTPEATPKAEPFVEDFDKVICQPEAKGQTIEEKPDRYDEMAAELLDKWSYWAEVKEEIIFKDLPGYLANALRHVSASADDTVAIDRILTEAVLHDLEYWYKQGAPNAEMNGRTGTERLIFALRQALVRKDSNHGGR